MAPQPVVTGLSPKEGPPGTRVIIRGEFLGTRVQDLIGTCCVRHYNRPTFDQLFVRF